MRTLWVVVPAYNEAAQIGETLACLAAQSDREFTLVVVDNGSTDATGAVAREFAAGAPFPVHVIVENEKGVGSAVDTGFRFAIANGACLIARTDADCLPHRGWVAAARTALAGGAHPGRGHGDGAQLGSAHLGGAHLGGAGMVCGRIIARRDENGVVRRAAFRAMVGLAGAFGRLRPSNRAGGAYLAPYRMHAGNNMAITAELYLAVGGMPRRPSPTDRTFLNRVRRQTAAINRCRAMVVENSTRRLRAYGVLGTARWYLDGGSSGLTPDPR